MGNDTGACRLLQRGQTPHYDARSAFAEQMVFPAPTRGLPRRTRGRCPGHGTLPGAKGVDGVLMGPVPGCPARARRGARPGRRGGRPPSGLMINAAKAANLPFSWGFRTSSRPALSPTADCGSPPGWLVCLRLCLVRGFPHSGRRRCPPHDERMERGEDCELPSTLVASAYARALPQRQAWHCGAALWRPTTPASRWGRSLFLPCTCGSGSARVPLPGPHTATPSVTRPSAVGTVTLTLST